jgi:hypothetical protein
MFLHIDGTDKTYYKLSVDVKPTDNVPELVKSIIRGSSMH